MASQVAWGAYMGRSSLRESTPTPFMWSVCSWVTRMAESRAGSTPEAAHSFITLTADTPPSTRRAVWPQVTKRALPLEPLKRGQKAICMSFASFVGVFYCTPVPSKAGMNRVSEADISWAKPRSRPSAAILSSTLSYSRRKRGRSISG